MPVASAFNPSLGLESGQNYMHGCFDKTIDLALARNFRLGGSRTLQFRLEAFNAFNAVVYNARNTTLQVTSPINLTQSNPQFDASGNLVQTRLQPQNAGFGAATGAQAHAVDAGADPLPVLSRRHSTADSAPRDTQS